MDLTLTYMYLLGLCAGLRSKRLSRRFLAVAHFFFYRCQHQKTSRMFSVSPLLLSTHPYLPKQLSLAEPVRDDRLLLGVLLAALDDDRLRQSILRGGCCRGGGCCVRQVMPIRGLLPSLLLFLHPYRHPGPDPPLAVAGELQGASWLAFSCCRALVFRVWQWCLQSFRREHAPHTKNVNRI